MGTWGFGPFEDDSALDWADELAASDDFSLIKEAISAIPDDLNVEVEFMEAVAAIAASEVLASVIEKKPSEALPESVANWLDGHAYLAQALSLKADAQKALERVASSSELQELWEESGNVELWKTSVADIIQRLK